MISGRFWYVWNDLIINIDQIVSIGELYHPTQDQLERYGKDGIFQVNLAGGRKEFVESFVIEELLEWLSLRCPKFLNQGYGPKGIKGTAENRRQVSIDGKTSMVKSIQ